MAIPLPSDDLARTIARMNDTAANEAFARSIGQRVNRFVETNGRAPVVLTVGSVGGILADACLVAGAHHVVVVDTNADALEIARENLSKHHDPTKFTTLAKSSVQLPKSDRYDLVVFDTFGPTVNAFGGGLLAHDLISREIVPPGNALPCEGTMTVRLYESPALASDVGVGLYGGRFVVEVEPPKKQKKVKFLPMAGLVGQTVPQLTPVSDRVEVYYEDYTDADTPEWPSHVEIKPTRPVGLGAVLVLEWAVMLDDDASVGTAVGELNQLSPGNQRARTGAWGWVYADVVAIAGVSERLAKGESAWFKVDGTTSGVNLTAVDGPPAKIDTKRFTAKKRQTAIESTFAAAAKAT